jgi:glycosyltransferase involved in cell wall biosynthesis
MGWIIWTGLLCLVAGVWASRHLTISRAIRADRPLRGDSYGPDGSDAPRVSVLIAAKDEEDNIERAVRTMLDQDYPNFELIVINDRSEDRTAEILERIQAEQTDGRLRVVHIRELQDGWFGKNNAMHEGVAQATGEWLCFGDADCRQTSNHTLSVAVQHARARKADFLSVLPELETHGLWERIIQPVCGGLLVFWFRPDQVNDPANPIAYANGAFMLMSRACYDAIGGHTEVRTEVNEDMHMARLAKERRQRLLVVQNDGLYSVRMYSGFRQIWRGWSRIFYGCFGTFRRLRITVLALLVMNIFPYASALIAALVLLFRGWSAAGMGWQAVGLASFAAVALQQSVIARFYRLSRTSPWLAPTFIVGTVICIGILFNAMLKLNGRTATTWRGTTYRGSKVAPSSS